MMRRCSASLLLCLLPLLSLAQGAATAPVAEPPMAVEVIGSGGRGIPLALLPVGDADQKIGNVLAGDLKLSGMFEILPALYRSAQPYTQWRGGLINFVAEYQAQQNANGLWAGQARVHDIISGRLVAEINLGAKTPTVLAHLLADQIQLRITGIRGIAATYIAYTTRLMDKGQRIYKLFIAFADGSEAVELFSSAAPLLSPAISPNGKLIAYVSFEKGQAQVFVHDLSNNNRTPLVMPKGTPSSAPTWSKDGTMLAFAGHIDGSTNLYLMDWKSRRTVALTYGNDISTEPSFTADGSGIFFTSDRGGRPQVYLLNLADKAVKRITFDGKYNFAPQNIGRYLAFIGQRDLGFQLRLKDLENGNEFPLSTPGGDEALAFAPNGKNILLVSRPNGRNGRVLLFRVGVYGRQPIAIPTIGEPNDVAWAPD